MRSVTPLYGITLSLLTAQALSKGQNTSNVSAQQQKVLDDAATALSTLQNQTPKAITALQALGSSGIFGDNAGLASQNSLLITILEEVPPLAQYLSAALNQTNIPAPATTPTPTPTPIATPTPTPRPIQDPDTLINQCHILQILSERLPIMKQKVTRLALHSDASASVFYSMSKYIQAASGCRRSSSEDCRQLNDLDAAFQAVGITLLQESKQPMFVWDGLNKDYDVRLSNIERAIVSGTDTLQERVFETRVSMQC